ncbi:uncharacterized protein LOC131941117, partial [Physella acuta]|uniref:uncharacterized protein LOC131941117 n=1 Tax=Physella acuta TaxID=109671 RepID=UPI0027DBE882
TPRSSSSRQGRHERLVHDGIAASHCHVGDGYQHLGLLKLDPSSLRHGRLGGSWKHVKEVMQPGGKRLVFVDGQIAADEHIKSNMAAADVTRSASDLNRVNMVNHAHTGRHRTSLLEQIPVARYDMLDIRRGLERENWNIVR